MTDRRIIAVDVGNSRVKAGVVDLGAGGCGTAPKVALPKVISSVQLPVTEAMGWQPLEHWYRSAAHPGEAADATWWLASVNPPIQESLVRWLEAHSHRYRELRDPSLLPLSVDLPRPEKAGIDRLLNAVATNAARPPDKPAIIVDAGSAMTIDAVSPDGTFLGGAIFPGPTLAARALHEFTYWLPLVELSDIESNVTRAEHPRGDSPITPPCPLGRNTIEALASGLFWGNVGAVREMVDQLTRHLGWEAPLIVLTGGAATRLVEHLDRSGLLLPYLTLQGLALAAAFANGS